MAELRVIVGPDVGKTATVEDDSVTIGRGDDCHLCLSDQHTSMIHAVVEPLDTGWRLRDLETATGTAVNGDLIQESPLNFGDIIKVGVTLVLFGSGNETDEVQTVGSAELPFSHECEDG
jgi:pSer/pThr/pTyr-binding forkhead associated (FHA) protein